MRDCGRNKQTVYYALYQKAEKLRDESGNYTGELGPSYGEPQLLKLNVSPATGEAQTREFGESVAYDRVLSISRTDLSIDEKTIFWIDTADTTKSHDYEVVKVAEGLNSTRYAVKKVSVRD